MQNKLFSIVEPSVNLKNSIINKIKREEIKRTAYKIAISSGISLATIFVTIFSVSNIIKDAYQSGLSEYLSLIFSDGTLLISHWQTYLISITESLPMIQITVTVASVWIFAWSLNTVVETLKTRRQFFIRSINY